MQMQQQANSQLASSFDKKTFNQNEKPKDVRKSNIIAAKGIYIIAKFSLF